MTNFVTQPNADVLVKLTGRITSYKCKRERASFLFAETDRTKMGVVAIAASLAGAGGQAMATAANATALEEEADFIEFLLDDKAVKGWVWRSPFKEGDEVEVAAERRGENYEAFGVARLSDRTVALYPHCSRGRLPHFVNATKWWLIISSSGTLFVSLMMRASTQELLADGILQWGAFAFYSFFGAMIFSLSRRWLPFVRVAENIFRTFGWPNSSGIDLKKRTKARRAKDDSVEYGRFYFYY